MAAAGGSPSGEGRFERRSRWPAVVLVVLVAVIVGIPAWLDRAVPAPITPVGPGERVTLEDGGGNAVVVDLIPGWDRLEQRSGDQITLRTPDAGVSVRVAEAVADPRRSYERQTRQLRVAGAQVLPGKRATTGTGFSGLAGVLVYDGREGKLEVLAKGDTMLVVQSIAEPGPAATLLAQVTTMVNRIRPHG